MNNIILYELINLRNKIERNVIELKDAYNEQPNEVLKYEIMRLKECVEKIDSEISKLNMA